MTIEDAIFTLRVTTIHVACFSDSLEAIGMAMEALEKQILIKPNKTGMNEYECPACHKRLVDGYPCKCGQRIDWSEEKYD